MIISLSTVYSVIISSITFTVNTIDYFVDNINVFILYSICFTMYVYFFERVDGMIRLAKEEDLDQIMEIIDDAKAFMRLTGSKQWQGGYPNRNVLEKDIQTKTLYAYILDNRVVGIIALKQEFTKNYVDIDGKWEHPVSADDLVIHRLAIKKEYRGKKIAKALMLFALDYAKEHNIHYLKTDTHPLNVSMQKTAESVGFIRRGTVVSMLEEEDKYRYGYELII